MAKNKDKTEERYLDYVLIYTNTINEYSDELKSLCKKKRSGEVRVGKRKHTYFAINNGVTILNRKNDLEMSFSFNSEIKHVYFEKYKLHNFIESDLNANGLGQDFPSNKTVRTEECNTCFEKLLMSGIIVKSGEGFMISKDELY